MQPAGKKHFVRSAVLVLLLAAACVCACELAVCRFADPELYHRMTDPALAFGQEVCRRAGDRVRAVRVSIADCLDAVSLAAEERAMQAALRRVEASSPAESQSEPAREMPQPVPLQAPCALRLVWEGEQELLLGGKVPLVYYNQADPAWSGQLFRRDPIGPYGCGPTAMAMVVSTLTGGRVNPAELAAEAAALGYCSPGNGSALSIVPGMAQQYGLECVSLPVGDSAALEQALSGPGLVVALMGPGYFTRGGHFVVLHGLTEDGRVLLADSNSRVNSLTPWALGFLEDELSAGRGSGAPLWYITAPV